MVISILREVGREARKADNFCGSGESIFLSLNITSSSTLHSLLI